MVLVVGGQRGGDPVTLVWVVGCFLSEVGPVVLRWVSSDVVGKSVGVESGVESRYGSGPSVLVEDTMDGVGVLCGW